MLAHDIGSGVLVVPGLDPVTATAGGSGDNTDEAGTGVDRSNFLSATIMARAVGTIATTKTSTVTARLQHSKDDGATDAYADVPASALIRSGPITLQPPQVGGLPAETALGQAGGASASPLVLHHTGEGAVAGFIKSDYDLGGVKKFIRLVVKAVHTASGTDTTVLTGAIALGGAIRQPV